jgi:hypothetical protein
MFQYIRLFLFLQFLDLVTTYADITYVIGASEGNTLWSYLLSYMPINMYIMMIIGKFVGIVMLLTCLYILTIISTNKIYKTLNTVILAMCTFVVINNVAILLTYFQ